VPRLRPTGFRTQIVVSTVVLMAVVMVVLTAGTQAVLEWNTRKDVQRALGEKASAVLQIARATSGRLDQRSWAVLEPATRMYDGEGDALGGSVEHAVVQQADALAVKARQTGRQQDAEARDNLNLRAVPFTTRAGELGVFVVTVNSEPYERTEIEALVAMVVLGLLVVGVAGGIAWRVTRQALEPVAQMAERAADWSEHDLTHRFALGPPDNELSKLGETLDHLLDRVAEAIRSEQRLTSELAHELRTPLTAIQGAADLALLRGVGDDAVREDLETISAAARRMTEAISALLDLARSTRGGRQAATTTTPEVVAAIAPLVPAGTLLVDEASSPAVPIAAPTDLVVRALSPIVENAVRHAETRVVVRAHTDGAEVVIEVGDDGPGVSPDVRDVVFEPGLSGSGGTGLGLGISRRVARSLGGNVEVADPAAGRERGATFLLRLPRR
jgi:two-component system, OmpR family, sensor kinase